MESDVVVRLGEPDDADTLAQFNIAMARDTEDKRLDPPTVAQGVRAVLAHREYGFYVVAALGGEVVGSLLITFEWSDWRSGLFWWIQSLYVKPDFRRRGVLKQLYRYVTARASRETNVCGIRLYAEQSNRVAHRAYTTLGMQKTNYHIYETMF